MNKLFLIPIAISLILIGGLVYLDTQQNSAAPIKTVTNNNTVLATTPAVIPAAPVAPAPIASPPTVPAKIDTSANSTDSRYKPICAAVCGDNYAIQSPEMRDYLTCIDGNLKPLGSDGGRTSCTRYDGGRWASAHGGIWCVKVNTSVNREDWKQPVQCLGFVPEGGIHP